MPVLREKFLSYVYIEKNNPNFCDGNCHAKGTADAIFGDKISFMQPSYQSQLVYSSFVETDEAVEAAVVAAISERGSFEKAAAVIRCHILQANSLSAEMPCPPSLIFLHSRVTVSPLLHFLTILLAKSSADDCSERIRRIVLRQLQLFVRLQPELDGSSQTQATCYHTASLDRQVVLRQ